MLQPSPTLTKRLPSGRELHKQSAIRRFSAQTNEARAYSGQAACALRSGHPARAVALLRQSDQLWRDVRHRCPLDVELARSAQDAERDLAAALLGIFNPPQ